MNKLITNLEDNVDQVTIGDTKLILVGTAHVSQSSVDLAERIIETVKPDAVAVELCSARFESLKNPDRWRNTDIIKVLKDGKALLLLFQLILASYQKRLGDQLNVKPGAEMMASVKKAESLNIPIILADRDVKTTLRRAWSAVSAWTICKLFFSSLFQSFISLFKKEPAASIADEIEKMKKTDALELMMNEFAQALPDVKVPLIDERDQYLSSKIVDPRYKTVVAIVGAGHVPGMKNILGTDVDLEKLEAIPPTTALSKFMAILFPALLLFFLIAGFFTGGSEKTLDIATHWALYTGLAAAVGSIIALAHPLSVIAGAVAAPITTIHPLLAAGWIAGFVEAVIRKPTVDDVQNVLDDIGTIKGFWTNRLARVFLVMILTNLTTSIGMIWGTKVIASLL
jgi:pheromone shutdown-related protein TraB